MPAICEPEKLPLHPVLFEALCRATAKRMGIPSFCRVRRCGRQEECTGKLKPREIPRCFRGLLWMSMRYCRCASPTPMTSGSVISSLNGSCAGKTISAASVRPKRFAACLPLTSSGRFPSMSMSKTKHRRVHTRASPCRAICSIRCRPPWRGSLQSPMKKAHL